MDQQEEYAFPTTGAEVLEHMKNFETEESVQYGMSYKPDPTDVFIVTPPKCGTTWMQQIVHGLRTRGSMDFEEISSVVPWIELAHDMRIDIYAPQAARPHTFKTHSTISEIPQDGKYIVIERDLKDTLLSHYKFFEDFSSQKAPSVWNRLQGNISFRAGRSSNIFTRLGIGARIRMCWLCVMKI